MQAKVEKKDSRMSGWTMVAVLTAAAASGGCVVTPPNENYLGWESLASSDSGSTVVHSSHSPHHYH